MFSFSTVLSIYFVVDNKSVCSTEMNKHIGVPEPEPIANPEDRGHDASVWTQVSCSGRVSKFGRSALGW